MQLHVVGRYVGLEEGSDRKGDVRFDDIVVEEGVPLFFSLLFLLFLEGGLDLVFGLVEDFSGLGFLCVGGVEILFL